jgi:hypothetical protein
MLIVGMLALEGDDSFPLRLLEDPLECLLLYFAVDPEDSLRVDVAPLVVAALEAGLLYQVIVREAVDWLFKQRCAI